MKITDLSILCKWENLKNQHCIKYLFAPLYVCVCMYIFIWCITFFRSVIARKLHKQLQKTSSNEVEKTEIAFSCQMYFGSF